MILKHPNVGGEHAVCRASFIVVWDGDGPHELSEYSLKEVFPGEGCGAQHA